MSSLTLELAINLIFEDQVGKKNLRQILTIKNKYLNLKKMFSHYIINL
jgi:hypothetical protein